MQVGKKWPLREQRPQYRKRESSVAKPYKATRDVCGVLDENKEVSGRSVIQIQYTYSAENRFVTGV